MSRRPKSTKSRVRRLTHGNGIDSRTLWGVILAVLAIVGIAGIVTATITLRGQGQPDPVTLCPADGPNGAFAILIDVTDPLTPFQQKALTQRLLQEILDLPVGTRVVLGLVSPDSMISNQTYLRLCKPLQGDKANALYQNPKLIEARFRDGFMTPLDQTLKDLLSTASADSSPIMESLQSLIVGAFLDLPKGAPKRLVIASDLLQHSTVFSFYRRQRWSDFEHSSDFGRLGRNLTDADVTLLQLPRPQYAELQNPAFLDFWARYFEAQGATHVRRVVIGDI